MDIKDIYIQSVQDGALFKQKKKQRKNYANIPKTNFNVLLRITISFLWALRIVKNNSSKILQKLSE